MIKYETIEHGTDEDPWYAVVIREGAFENVVYRYNWGSIPDNVDPATDEGLNFRFSYDIIEHNDMTIGEEIEPILFEILCDIIEKELARREDEPNRNDDSQ